MHGERVLEWNAEIGSANALIALEQKSSAGEQNYREADLKHEESAAQSGTFLASASRA